MGYLFVGCVPRVKTNLCSVTGKTGTGGKAVGRGARGSGLPSPAWRVFRSACHVETSIYRVSTFFAVRSAALRHCEEGRRSNPVKPHPSNNVCPQLCSAAAMSSQRWPVRWLGIYGCVSPFANHSFIRRQVALTPCERFPPPSLRGTKQIKDSTKSIQGRPDFSPASRHCVVWLPRCDSPTPYQGSATLHCLPINKIPNG